MNITRPEIQEKERINDMVIQLRYEKVPYNDIAVMLDISTRTISRIMDRFSKGESTLGKKPKLGWKVILTLEERANRAATSAVRAKQYRIEHHALVRSQEIARRTKYRNDGIKFLRMVQRGDPSFPLVDMLSAPNASVEHLAWIDPLSGEHTVIKGFWDYHHASFTSKGSQNKAKSDQGNLIEPSKLILNRKTPKILLELMTCIVCSPTWHKAIHLQYQSMCALDLHPSFQNWAWKSEENYEKVNDYVEQTYGFRMGKTYQEFLEFLKIEKPTN